MINIRSDNSVIPQALPGRINEYAAHDHRPIGIVEEANTREELEITSVDNNLLGTQNTENMRNLQQSAEDRDEVVDFANLQVSAQRHTSL